MKQTKIIYLCSVLILLICVILSYPMEKSTVPEEVKRSTSEKYVSNSSTEDEQTVDKVMDKEISEQGTKYIVNENSGIFHDPSCYSAKQIKDTNRREFFGSREELIETGYKPCGRCHP